MNLISLRVGAAQSNAISYVALVLYLAWDGSAKYIFVLGLISAIPAAVCSWLSSDRQTRVA